MQRRAKGTFKFGGAQASVSNRAAVHLIEFEATETQRSAT